MQFNRVANIETAHKVLNELRIIPEKLLKITDEFGLQIYCFDEVLRPSWIGLMNKDEELEDGRRYDETACYNPKYKAIFIYDWDFKDIGEKAFSTMIHEYGHALDNALAVKQGKDDWLSYIDQDIYKGWEQGKGLDWYANINPLEYFAQAFMAYLYDLNYRPWSYREHTKQELKEKDPNMFYYLQALLS